jgi:hypothetical protein
MLRHLNRKVKCTRNIKSYKYSDEDINILSLKKLNDNIIIEDDNIINDKNNFNKDSIINKEKDEIMNIKILDEDSNYLEIIDNEEFKLNLKKDNKCKVEENTELIESYTKKIIPQLQNNPKCILLKKSTNNSQNIEYIAHPYDIKDKKCPSCDKYFTRRSSLIRHIENNRCKNVFYKTEQKITNNITNNNNTIIINLNINKPLPFDSDWDVSNIDNTLKQVLLLSDLKYTKTLEYILENDVNLNVIIEDESDCGIVYKNDVEKFKPMKIDDIVDLSMDKLHKQLTIFHEEIKDNNKYKIKDTLLKSEKYLLDEKYDAYKNNENTQNLVKSYISNIYNKKKDDTIKMCSELLDLGKIEGY